MRNNTRLNDHERWNWIMNTWSLYNWFRGCSLTKREFLRRHRAEIDAAIQRELNKQPWS